MREKNGYLLVVSLWVSPQGEWGMLHVGHDFIPHKIVHDPQGQPPECECDCGFSNGYQALPGEEASEL